MQKTQKCERCGASFEAKPHLKKKFCSERCRELEEKKRASNRREERRRGDLAYWQNKGETLRCKQCGQSFERKPGRGARPKFCSVDCTQLFHSLKRAHERGYEYRPSIEGETQQCIRCGNEFIVSGTQPNKYCSECKYPARLERVNRRNNEIAEVRRSIPIPVRPCERCSNSFQSRQPGQKYCSDCQHVAKLEKNRRLTQNKRREQDAIDGMPNATNRDVRAKHALRKIHGCVPATLYEHINAKKVYERDGWICGICGKPIDRDTQFPLPLSASVDHIIALSKGGSHLYANVQTAHLRCNIAKGNNGGIPASNLHAFST